MSIKEIEAAVLKLVPKDRARLAEKLLQSLEELSEQENEVIWAQEAQQQLGPQPEAARERQKLCSAAHAQNSDK